MGVYDSDEEWECFLCEGRSYCKVCQGTGNIGKNSVLRKLINSIVDKRVKLRSDLIKKACETSAS